MRYTDDYKFKIGRIYSVNKEIPVMPIFDPEDRQDQLPDMIQKIHRLQPGQSFVWLKRKPKRGHHWHLVRISGTKKLGWVNGIALLGADVTQHHLKHVGGE